MRCSSCPVDLGLVCEGERHARFCSLAATREDYRRHLVETATGVRTSRTPEARIRPEAIRAVLECDYRGPKVGRGCGCRNVCFLGKGEVTTQDCLACMSSSSPPASAG